jgi:hypothetical protein
MAMDAVSSFTSHLKEDMLQIFITLENPLHLDPWVQ